MTIIAVWCRHTQDNVIGIGEKIPWHVSSDFKRFRRITEGSSLVAGQKTYESFPNRTLPNRQIYVLTFDTKYEVSDPQNHEVVNDLGAFKNFEGNLFVAGGASVYKAFMNPQSKVLPDIVVDSVYMGDLDVALVGQKVDISPCVETMMQKYRKVSPDYEEDNVLTSIWIKKGEFVDQSVLKHIVKAIENEGEN